MNYDNYKSCIDACCDCVVECGRCVTACIEEKDNSMLTRCIRLDLDCKSACLRAIDALASDSEFAGKICELCSEICDSCADECLRHPQFEHCRSCAKICQACAEECRSMANVAA